MKNRQSKIKPIKTENEIERTYCLGCKDYTHNFKPQEVKMINKAFRQKSNCVKSNATSKNNSATI